MYRKRITGTSGKAAFRVEITGLNGAAIPSGPIGVQIQQTATLNESINPNQYPLRGISFNNLSAAFFGGGAVTGPIQQRLFGSVNGCYSAPGTTSVNEYLYNKSVSVTLGLDTFLPRVNPVVARLGTNRLFTTDTGRGVFYMSPSGGEDIDLIIWIPCVTTFGANVDVNVFCSNTLREFTAYFSGAVKPPGCVIGTLLQSNVFMGNVQNALGGAIGLYDWAFSDFMASGVKADGYYYLPPQAGLPLPASNASILVTNGIVTEFNNPCV
jgi:hypothetical protein